MKKAARITFGAILAASMLAPQLSNAHDLINPFAVYIEANYTKPSNNGLSVGDLLFAPVVAGPFDGGRRHVFIEPKNQYDYSLGATYRFAHSHTRLFLDYDHYSNHQEQGDINLRNDGLAPAPDTFGFSRVDINAYEFRVGAIHDLHFDRYCIDLYAFLENVKLTQTLFETAVQQNVAPPDELIDEPFTSNKMWGFGPGVGAMARVYPFRHCPQWNLFAGMMTSLLYGEHQYFESFVSNAGNFYIYDPEDTNAIVAKLDIQFGLNYHHALRHEMHGMKWDISLGMRYMNMFNALKNGNTAWQPNAQLTGQNSGNFPANFAANLGSAKDWGRYGPFLRFKIGGANS